MMSIAFDEWFEKNGELYRKPTNDECYLFEAGAQSRQEEVLKLQDEVDELQNRINKTVEYIECYYGVVELSAVVDILEGK